jgi:hypothetical protein
MNPELLALIEAFESLREAPAAQDEAQALAKFESLVQACLERNLNVSRDSLERTIALAHGRWCKAEDALRQRRSTT